MYAYRIQILKKKIVVGISTENRENIYLFICTTKAKVCNLQNIIALNALGLLVYGIPKNTYKVWQWMLFLLFRCEL